MAGLFTLSVFFIVLRITISGVPDNEGREFVFAFGSNPGNGGNALEVFVTTRSSNTVTVTYTTEAGEQMQTVTQGTVFSYSIDVSYRLSSSNNTVIEEKALFISADDDIMVYASNKVDRSADAFLVLPTDVLGMEYYIPSWPSDLSQNFGGSMVVVAAVEDGTKVRIELLGELIEPDFILNRGQAYQYLGQRLDGPETTVASKIDITGAKVTSDKPIAVLSGSRRVAVLPTIYGRTADHLVEMIPPVNTLGREFFLASFFERKSDAFRIVAANSYTEINITRSAHDYNITTLVLSDAGEYYQFESSENEVMWVNCNSSVIVAQYSKTYSSIEGAKSDPMMSLVPPREQYGNNYTFTTPTGVITPYRNYVNIVIKSTEVNGLTLDGSGLTLSLSDYNLKPGDTFTTSCWAQDGWQAIGDTGYSARTMAVVHGTHNIAHAKPNVVFYALMYGHVQYESYGFPAGSRLASIGAYCTPSDVLVNDGVDNDCDSLIDEELSNGIDDDGDGSIDEDLSANDHYPLITTVTLPLTSTPAISTTSTTDLFISSSLADTFTSSTTTAAKPHTNSLFTKPLTSTTIIKNETSTKSLSSSISHSFTTTEGYTTGSEQLNAITTQGNGVQQSTVSVDSSRITTNNLELGNAEHQTLDENTELVMSTAIPAAILAAVIMLGIIIFVVIWRKKKSKAAVEDCRRKEDYLTTGDEDQLSTVTREDNSIILSNLSCSVKKETSMNMVKTLHDNSRPSAAADNSRPSTAADLNNFSVHTDITQI